MRDFAFVKSLILSSRYLVGGKPKPCGWGALSGVPKKEASASFSSSLNTIKLGFFSVQGAHLPPLGPLGSLYFTKLLQSRGYHDTQFMNVVHKKQKCYEKIAK